MTYYERENALLITGGRNERERIVYADAYFLTLDKMEWIKVNILGQGMIGRTDQ